MLFQSEVPILHPAVKALHREVKFRIIHLNGSNAVSDLDFRIEFLADFPQQSLLRSFPGLNLAARKLPPALELAVSALRRKNPTVLFNYCCHYVNCSRP